MKKNVKSYLFWLKVFASALLLVFGLWVIIDKEIGEKIVVSVTGAAIIIYYLIRIIPLFKNKLQTQALLITSVVEIVIALLVGALLFYVGVSNQAGADSWISTTVTTNYNIILGLVLYARGVIYFITTTFLKDEQTKLKFFVHMLFITFGAISVAADYDASSVAFVLAILSLLGAVYLGVDSGIDYNNFRKSKNVNKETAVGDEVEKQDEATLEFPNAIIEEDKRDIVN